MKSKLLIIALLLVFISGCGNENKSSKTTSEQNTTAQITKEEIKKDDSNDQKEPIKATPKDEVKKQTANFNEPFELTLLDGRKINLQKFEQGFKVEGNDEAILFNFFATWCPPCKAEIPHLNNLQDKFKGKLKIISVLLEDKQKSEIEAFAKHYNAKFDIAYGENNYYFAKAVGGVVGIPYMVLYRADGTYATHYVGLVPEEMLENDINKVIK